MIRFTQVAEVIDLPNPELQDLDQVGTKTILRRSMSGVTRSYVRTPMSRKILLTFNDLDGADITAFKDFLAALDETQVTYRDVLLTDHVGYLLTQTFEITNTHDDATCGLRSIRVEFEYE
tara:strand:- start:3214 stop:3573 length:360 start_codon:yes stop_codon:yes gene_type:complete